MRFCIIEHDTRGVFTELDFDVVTGEPKPHFSPTASRVDERVEKFFHREHAKRVLTRFPAQVRARCSIIASPKRGEVEWTKVV